MSTIGNHIADWSNYSPESVDCNAEMYLPLLFQENGLSDHDQHEPDVDEGVVQSVVLTGAHAAC